MAWRDSKTSFSRSDPGSGCSSGRCGTEGYRFILELRTRQVCVCVCVCMFAAQTGCGIYYGWGERGGWPRCHGGWHCAAACHGLRGSRCTLRRLPTVVTVASWQPCQDLSHLCLRSARLCSRSARYARVRYGCCSTCDVILGVWKAWTITTQSPSTGRRPWERAVWGGSCRGAGCRGGF